MCCLDIGRVIATNVLHSRSVAMELGFTPRLTKPKPHIAYKLLLGIGNALACFIAFRRPHPSMNKELER